MSKLLSDIEGFLKAKGMTPTTFGESALNDRKFVFDLREGRRVWEETETKVRDFMRDYRAPVEEPAIESRAA